MQHKAYHFNILYACVARRKGKQCGFSTVYSKGTLAIFSQRAIVSRGDKLISDLFNTLNF